MNQQWVNRHVYHIKWVNIEKNTCELPSWLRRHCGSCEIYHSKNCMRETFPSARLSSLAEQLGHDFVLFVMSSTFPVSSDTAATIPSLADQPLLLHEQSKLTPASTTFCFSSSSVHCCTFPTSRKNCFSSHTASLQFILISSFAFSSKSCVWFGQEYTGDCRSITLANFCAAALPFPIARKARTGLLRRHVHSFWISVRKDEIRWKCRPS